MAQKKVEDFLYHLISITGSSTGDINLTIQQIVKQHNAIIREQWRHLGRALLPTTFSPAAFAELIGIAMIQAFQGQDYVQFVSIIDLAEQQGHLCYQLTSQYASFTGSVDHLLVAASNETDKDEAIGKWKKIKGDFVMSIRFSLDHTFNCVQFTYDAKAKTVEATPIIPPSTRPQDYPDKLKTTSEILQYFSALCDAHRTIVDIGDPLYVTDYSWIKFYCHFVDTRSIDLGRLKTNTADPEEWDFIYPEVDYETRSAPKAE